MSGITSLPGKRPSAPCPQLSSSNFYTSSPSIAGYCESSCRLCAKPEIVLIANGTGSKV
jgi:hypothetical protein